LTDDYTDKVSLKCKKSAGPVAVTIETEQGKGGALSSKIGTKFAYAKFNVDKGQVKADGGRVLETSLGVRMSGSPSGDQGCRLESSTRETATGV
jgi:voltage-dependent anion channel protein 2